MFGTSVILFSFFFSIGNSPYRLIQRESKSTTERAKARRQVVIHIKEQASKDVDRYPDWK
jgi:hypothetical protein